MKRRARWKIFVVLCCALKKVGEKLQGTFTIGAPKRTV